VQSRCAGRPPRSRCPGQTRGQLRSACARALGRTTRLR
jgi:hypothetical protein